MNSRAKAPRYFWMLAIAMWAAAVSHAADARLTAKIVDAGGRAVPDAVVSLYALGQQLAPPLPPAAAPVEIVQQDQEYVPYVSVVRAGSQVDFPNKDDIQHHIYSLSKAKRFEKPLYAPGSRESVVFDQPGIVTLGCNIHDWMVAYIVVLPTPYFAKSDAAGHAIVTAPAGKYRLEVWHPRLAKNVTRELTLAEVQGAIEFTLTLKPDRRVRRAPEAKGGGY